MYIKQHNYEDSNGDYNYIIDVYMQHMYHGDNDGDIITYIYILILMM